jgi:GNAT superfamily N-acetyltransferase
MLIIRDYESTDLQRVNELHVTVMQDAGVYKGDGPWDDDLKDIEGVYLKDGGAFLVGERNGRIVAMGAFKKSNAGLAEVKRMRVETELQGMGYGRQILEVLEERARALGYEGFHLETSEYQIAAQKLYETCGFEEVGRTIIDGFNCILYFKQF